MNKTPSILDHYPDYEVTIGIEVHVQLSTKSKIFCSCANEITKEQNHNIDQICCGHPGVLPVLNKKVVDYAILAGLATHSEIAKISEFARKHYFYPDLPKNYQITQNDKPICVNGYVPIRLEDGSVKKVRLIRIHMEEDAGKNVHSGAESFVNLNRAGTPLLEIVTHPDIASTYEARTYLKALHTIVRYLNICSGNMEEGAFRADTNISVRKKGATKLGTRCELKNINSFKFISDAVEYEIERQITLLEEGKQVQQETRLWDGQQTKPMRSKEEAADYRYFPDPDLPIIEINEEWIRRVQAQLPELPHDKFERFCTEKGLSEYEADILVHDAELAAYFEKATTYSSSKLIINWILRDLLAYLKDNTITLMECKMTPERLAALADLLEKGTINNNAAKEVFALVAQTGKEPVDIVKEKGLEQIGSKDELEAIIKDIIAKNPEQVEQYKASDENKKARMFGFFVGQAMKQTQGKANAQLLQELLKKYLQ